MLDLKRLRGTVVGVLGVVAAIAPGTAQQPPAPPPPIPMPAILQAYRPVTAAGVLS